MRLYYGAAIQGAKDRKERVEVHKTIINHISSLGGELLTEHTTCDSREEVLKALERRFGPLPTDRKELATFTRNKMIECVEGPIDAAIFEVSTPSHGTGIEIAHAYLRPRMGLKAIPILALYEEGYWQNNASIMISGIPFEVVPNFKFRQYKDLEMAKELITSFFVETRGQLVKVTS